MLYYVPSDLIFYEYVYKNVFLIYLLILTYFFRTGVKCDQKLTYEVTSRYPVTEREYKENSNNVSIYTSNCFKYSAGIV